MPSYNCWAKHVFILLHQPLQLTNPPVRKHRHHRCFGHVSSASSQKLSQRISHSLLIHVQGSVHIFFLSRPTPSSSRPASSPSASSYSSLMSPTSCSFILCFFLLHSPHSALPFYPIWSHSLLPTSIPPRLAPLFCCASSCPFPIPQSTPDLQKTFPSFRKISRPIMSYKLFLMFYTTSPIKRCIFCLASAGLPSWAALFGITEPVKGRCNFIFIIIVSFISVIIFHFIFY